MHINGPERYGFGKRKSDGANIFLYRPSWDCGWYWGMGYLGNAHEHYHLHGYQKKDHVLKLEGGGHKFLTEHRNKNMHDCLKEDYDLNPNIERHLWTFCELMKTAYALKETAEVLGRGGSHYTTNPMAAMIKNEDAVKRINKVVLPAIFHEVRDLVMGIGLYAKE